ncbi:MAG TPA: acetate uptake transporter [Solirubrobacteraceae bacterium]|nr:acetate uptake transporter [Solirubrobacteraceae bacterium]
MAIVDSPPPIVAPPAGSEAAHNGAARTELATPPGETTLGWGNSAPLALLAFGVPTFMLSMINADAISKGVEPVVFGVALMCGGITALIAGIIQFRTGKTFSGVLFCGFGAFWLSLFAIAQWFLKSVPPAQVGHALGLFLYAFGIFLAVMFLASFRTNLVVVLTLALIGAAVFLLAAGNYGAHTTLIHWGGYTGLAATACIFYMALAELCEICYQRVVLPVWPLAAH